MNRFIGKVLLLSTLVAISHFFNTMLAQDLSGSYNANDYSYNNESNMENILIILDSSYSMKDKIDGRQKIEIAKDVIIRVLEQIPVNVRIGLRIYGHKSGILGLRSCRASELKVPIGHNNKKNIADQLFTLKPEGWTPITYSIKQALENDFIGVSGKKRIILVTDGMETCDGSPCEYVLSIVRQNIDIKIDVIGFDIDEPEAIAQLKCTSLATKGKFYSASTAAELFKKLRNSINAKKEVQGKVILH